MGVWNVGTVKNWSLIKESLKLFEHIISAGAVICAFVIVSVVLMIAITLTGVSIVLIVVIALALGIVILVGGLWVLRL